MVCTKLVVVAPLRQEGEDLFGEGKREKGTGEREEKGQGVGEVGKRRESEERGWEEERARECSKRAEEI